MLKKQLLYIQRQFIYLQYLIKLLIAVSQRSAMTIIRYANKTSLKKSACPEK